MSLHLMLATWQKSTPREILSAAASAIAISSGCFARFDLADPDDESDLRDTLGGSIPTRTQVLQMSIVGSPDGTDATDLWIEGRSTASTLFKKFGKAPPAQPDDVTRKRDWPPDYDCLVGATRLGRFLRGIAEFARRVDVCLAVFDEGGAEGLVSDSPDRIALDLLRQLVLPWDCLEYRTYHLRPEPS